MRGHAQTQVALRDGLLVSVYPRPAEFTAGDSPGGMAKVPPCQRRSTCPRQMRAFSSHRAVGRGDLSVRWSVFGICRFYGRWLLLPWLFDRLQ